MGKNTGEGFDKKHDNEKQPKKAKNKIIIIGIIAAIVATLAVVSYTLDNTKVNSFPLVDGIECDSVEYAVFHIHAHLDIFVDGHQLTIPAYVGIEDNTCLYWVHTHSTDGIIHIESPKQRGYTLGEFFDIWHSTNTGLPPADNEPIIYVNGQVVTTNLKDVPLNAHDEITLVYGNPPTNIPSFYQFPEGD